MAILVQRVEVYCHLKVIKSFLWRQDPLGGGDLKHFGAYF